MLYAGIRTSHHFSAHSTWNGEPEAVLRLPSVGRSLLPAYYASFTGAWLEPFTRLIPARQSCLL